ncbi:MAG: EFR1 family ferrodoxin [Lentimicrobiaceae bacterium]|nr:EFR1 family ferrodoxin [Lentimicrobiaceae bacterium]
MIFYFSGTGNSLWAAKELSPFYNSKLISISEKLLRPDNDFSYAVAPNEKIFFVFPVHSWGTDVLTYRFLEKINLVNYQKQPVFMVCTCGGNCGYADKIVKKMLRKKNIVLTKSYSIQMPNNYVLMKGFGTDSKEIEEKKIANASLRIQHIVDDIFKSDGEKLYARGAFPFLKSRIIYPLFRKYGVKRNLFYAKNNCISCGLCVNICPTKTIFWQDKTPKWHKETCVQCTACINRCPERAIEYGKISETKGRYHHPEI